MEAIAVDRAIEIWGDVNGVVWEWMAELGGF